MSDRSARYPRRESAPRSDGIRLMPPRFVELSREHEAEVVELLADILIDALRRRTRADRNQGRDDEETDDDIETEAGD